MRVRMSFQTSFEAVVALKKTEKKKIPSPNPFILLSAVSRFRVSDKRIKSTVRESVIAAFNPIRMVGTELKKHVICNSLF